MDEIAIPIHIANIQQYYHCTLYQVNNREYLKQFETKPSAPQEEGNVGTDNVKGADKLEDN